MSKCFPKIIILLSKLPSGFQCLACQLHVVLHKTKYLSSILIGQLKTIMQLSHFFMAVSLGIPELEKRTSYQFIAV